ncbi:putative disease resistance protein RGA1 [Papaver somniferum]|uniref:putative disease resistance protein RGA1 n=1 Tax=Papaver somniferum TaxID=3469 RepID=UPI000E6F7D65|nr:putative disease resistance protein RGA1 [Papaver somniferum]
MAEILMNGATEILRKLVGVVSEDIGSALGFKDDLKKLQNTSEKILAVIADAEKRQVKEEVIRVWLRRLKDIAYDADDVIEEFSYEDLRRSDRENYSKHKVINFTSSSNPPLVFQLKMSKKIKKIHEKFENITKDMDRYQLEYTKPIPDGEKIFDIQTILVQIMESIKETKFHKFAIHRLGKIVQEHLEGKKYLLVLDDLWNEDSEQWGYLMSVLLAGAPGSKVLITTRNNRVASIVRGSIPPYNLGRLEDDACWSIVKQKAFSPGGALDAPKMSEIGKEIAKKCCGLPLAAKFVGSLMRSKNKESDWIKIRDDDIWNTPDSKRKILHVLKFSYNYLPSHLKQCFSYCSIFPKNWEINKETLVHLWMAEGFLKKCNTNKKSVEDFGRDYFESLAWSSFFEDFKTNKLGNIVTCKMHDLVHDLAKDVLGENELVLLMASDFKDISEARRLRLELDEDISAASQNCLINAKKLRTIFISEGSKLNPSIFPEKNHLRILYLGRAEVHGYFKLPSLSFKLRHLRYLRLSSLDIEEVKNDQSIGELYNLETLILNNMHGVQNLLSNIHSLQKLRYLEVSGSDMVKLPNSVISLSNLQALDLNNCKLVSIPESIPGLKNLRFLNLSFNPIKELPVSIITLSNLKTLDVNTCKHLKALPQKVADLVSLRIFHFKECKLLKELPEDFGELSQLRSLDLEGTGIRVLPKSCSNLYNLEFVHLSLCQPPKDVTNWRNLRRFYYSSMETPSPLGVGNLVFLQRLSYKVREKVLDHDGIEELSNLSSLEVLDIGNLEKVKYPRDAESANLKGKQNLRQLHLTWGSGRWSEVEENLKRKQDLAGELSRYWSEMMRSMRWDQKSSNFQVFEALQPPSGLKSLHISNFMGMDFPTWMRVPSGLPNLVKLILEDCFGLEQFPAAIGKIPSLRVLHLEGVSLMSLDIGGFPSLVQLNLNDIFLLQKLHYSSASPSFLQDLKIRGCGCLTRIPSFPSLTFLELDGVNPKLVFSVERTQKSLAELWLKNIDGLVYFPISILQNNRNLQSLYIDTCHQLEGFQVNEGEIENESSKLHIGSLQKLNILACPVLKFLPDLRRWTSLQKLRLICCPQLKKYLAYDLKDLTFVKELDVDNAMMEDPSPYEELFNLLERYGISFHE